MSTNRYYVMYQKARVLQHEECAFMINILPNIKSWMYSLNEILEQAPTGLIIIASSEIDVQNGTTTTTSSPYIGLGML